MLPGVVNDNQNFMNQYNIPGWPTDSYAIGSPTLNIANVSTITATREIPWVAIPFKLTENTYQYMDTVNWQIGKHAIKFGADFDHLRMDEYSARSGGGGPVFNGAYTTQTVGGSVSSPRNGVADMLLGDASSFTARYQFSPGTAMKTYRLSELYRTIGASRRISP